MWQPLHEELSQPRWQMSNREQSTRLRTRTKKWTEVDNKRGAERTGETNRAAKLPVSENNRNS
jgi:hypothetical protein